MSVTRHRAAGIGAVDRVIAVKDIAVATNQVTFGNLNGEHDAVYRLKGLVNITALSYLALRLNNNSGTVYDHVCQKFLSTGHSIVDSPGDTVINLLDSAVLTSAGLLLVDIRISAMPQTAGFLVNCKTSSIISGKGAQYIITGGSSENAALNRIDLINDFGVQTCYGAGTKLTLTASR